MAILQKNKFYKKTKKLINNPGLFFRDYLNKKYASFTNEQKILEADETAIVRHELARCRLESKLNGIDKPIDVVFTWVNDTDDEWRERYVLANEQAQEDLGLYAKDNARFENHNELYYLVYSVLTYLKWVNRIFIVTDNQTPDWIEEIDSNKITIIDHKQIIDSQYLPTFNSHVIEANLHKSPI
ncbi:MAG: Stealth CR1 domain-containing protein [Moraxella sp.]|uniref:Stealth CR1 domain-containing protein n=1 Tax=Moraxella sp. TaxID=479 RepID=UPI0026DC2F25|nr:Stealth CR1 domain-containing protein [Moraxella sp.]MDO4449663.1 Stealth CR1 domain-containing protein [Moraxella sp.]